MWGTDGRTGGQIHGWTTLDNSFTRGRATKGDINRQSYKPHNREQHMGNNTCQFHTTVKVSLIITGAILDSLQINGSINFKTVSLFMTYKLHFFHSFHNGRNSRRMAVTTVQNIKVYSRQNRTRLQKLERAVKLFVYRHIEDYSNCV